MQSEPDPETRAPRRWAGVAGSSLQQRTLQTWLAVGLLVLAWVAYRLLWPVLAVVVPPLLLAALIVYALEPIVTRFAAWRLPRWFGATVAYLAVALLVAGAVAVAVPVLGRQLADFVAEAPQLRTRVVDAANQLAGWADVDLDLRPADSGAEVADEVVEETRDVLANEERRQRILAFLGGLSGAATGFAHAIAVLVVAPVIGFYVLVDRPRLNRAVWSLVSPRHRAEAQTVAVAVGRVVGGYVRGQLLVSLFVAVATSAGLALVGLPFWLLVGILAGVANLIPLVGPVVGGLVGVAIALLTDGPALVVGVLAVVVIVQQLDNHVVSPLVMGKTVHVHPLAVLLALLVAATLYGILGMLVAVPLVAAAKVILGHLWQTRVPWAENASPALEAQDAGGVNYGTESVPG